MCSPVIRFLARKGIMKVGECVSILFGIKPLHKCHLISKIVEILVLMLYVSAKLYLLSRLSTTDSNNLRSVRLCSITSNV